MEENKKIKTLKETFIQDLEKVETLKELRELRIYYLGKKGPVKKLRELLKEIEVSLRKEFGLKLNDLQEVIETNLIKKEKDLEELELKKRIEEERIDITLPKTNLEEGGVHPLTKTIDEIEDIFKSMGYDIVYGPEIESDLYNFEYLNVQKDHPARDMQDSFYLTEEYLLRTQTSNAQIRIMLNNKEKTPIRALSPGKVYRRDNDDATHSHQFMQIEGLVVDQDITLGHLKGTLAHLAKRLFGEDRKIRFRPSYFPFTEPSLEVDISCFKCGGKGCSICKNSGWIEILGSGMVHPFVLKIGGYDPNIYTGFAFGLGVERIAMLKYGIFDIRDFYLNDLRFLKQFNRVEGGVEDES
ncbi:MAG: phenylalanine--tRNA ligase subunit alpha [Bacilli bacterium]|jgi:phenylalanyl-tRNA synthetase alpha chain